MRARLGIAKEIRQLLSKAVVEVGTLIHVLPHSRLAPLNCRQLPCQGRLSTLSGKLPHRVILIGAFHLSAECILTGNGEHALKKTSTEKCVPVVVTMRVYCGCGHVEDETYEFDMPSNQSQPMEAYEPGTCPECSAPVQIYLRRTSALQ